MSTADKIDPIDVTYDPSGADSKHTRSDLLNTLVEENTDTEGRSTYTEHLVKLRGRWTFILMFAFLQTVIGFQLGYIFCYTN